MEDKIIEILNRSFRNAEYAHKNNMPADIQTEMEKKLVTEIQFAEKILGCRYIDLDTKNTKVIVVY